MKRWAAIGVVAMTAGLALAQQATTNAAVVRQQLAGVDAQLAALRAQARESPQLDAARQAARDAEKVYADALAAIPEIKVLDEQIAAARDQLRELALKRQQTLAANAGQVAAVRQARDDAAARYRQAALGGAAAEQLLSQRRDLVSLIGAIEGGGGADGTPSQAPADGTVTNAGNQADRETAP